MSRPQYPFHILPRVMDGIGFELVFGLGFPGGSDGKTSACSVGDPGSIPQ